MDFKQQFIYQIDYQHWANDALFNALDRLDNEARTSPQKLYSGSIHNSVDHLLFFYAKWFARLRGEHQTGGYVGMLHPDWRELKNAMRHEIREMQRWLERQPQDFFDERLFFKRTSNRQENSLWVRDALTHVFTFASIERGQISAVAAALGAPFPDMSYYSYRQEMGDHLQNMRKSETAAAAHGS
jgi:uncharacterized damage-inducible protein DinB